MMWKAACGMRCAIPEALCSTVLSHPPEPRQYHHNFKNITVAAAVLPPLLVPSLTLLLLMPIPLWRPPLMLQHPQHRHYVTTVAIAGTAVANTALPLPLLLLRPTLLCRRCCCRCC
jgi:hypothetical protein